MSRRILLLFVCLFLLFNLTQAATEKYRIMWRDDPSSTMVIGWVQSSGTGPEVYYDTIDHGTNWAAYSFQHGVDRSVSFKGMDHQFARLSGLQPNTAYYFLIKDSEGISQRLWFKTTPDTPDERLSFIAGGDSRNNRTPRQSANLLVSKLRTHFVAFGGDYTASGFNSEWAEWLDDWQLTISADGRMTPIVATRGNHEAANDILVNIFDVPSAEVYYASTFGGSLLRMYTLNSEINVTGSQYNWLVSDLAANTNVLWKSAQYHKPIRPHVASKPEQEDMRNYWGQAFYDYGVKLVVECDAHTVKTTWPIRPTYDPGHDEGFIRDDDNGTVYVGEGCWGAPLRDNDDNKDWTRSSDKFNQFKWIFVDQQKIEVRTVRVDNAASVGEVNDTNIFIPPANIDLWSPSNGAVVVIPHPDAGKPAIQITEPDDQGFYYDIQHIQINADAIDTNGTVTQVAFYQNGTLIVTDNALPYSTAWIPPSTGNYELTAVATDNDGNNKMSLSVNIYVGFGECTAQVIDGNDDAEEQTAGSMYITSSDLELTEDAFTDQWVGIRFQKLNIPKGANILHAYIQFTVDETSTGSTSVMITAEAVDNASAFSSTSYNISSRTLTGMAANWSIPPWTVVGAAGIDQRTPDLSMVVQEVVDRPGWATGQSIAFIITGSGSRTAVAYEGDPSKVPKLYVKYNMGPFIPPELGQDVTLCEGDTISISPGSQFSSYKWSHDPFLQGPSAQIYASGLYIVDVTGGSTGTIISKDSLFALFSPLPLVDLGPDTISCGVKPLSLSASGNQLSYQWNTGVTDSLIVVSQSGEYTLTVTNTDGCSSTDTIEVLIGESPVTILGDSMLCDGCTYTLSTNSGYAEYLWSTGAVSESIAVSSPGLYSVTATDIYGCTSFDNIQIISSSDTHTSMPETAVSSHLIVYPNPTTGAFIISYNINKAGYYSISLLDKTGTTQKQLLHKWYTAGEYSQKFDIKGLQPEIYFLLLQGANTYKYIKILIIN